MPAAKTKTRRSAFRFHKRDALLQNMMEHSRVGMALEGPNECLVYANEAYARIFGYKREECIGLSAADVVFPEDRSHSAQLGQVRRGEADGYNAERRYRRKDGSAFWGRVAASVLRDEQTGKQIYLILQVEDIDQQKRAELALADSERRWNFALEGAGQGVWDHDLRNGTTLYSPMWWKMRGLDPDEKAGLSGLADSGSAPKLTPGGKRIATPVREAWMQRLHPEDRERILNELNRQDTGQLAGFSSFEYRERHRDGHYMWVQSRGRPIEWMPDGSVARVIGTDTDITSIKEQEARDAAEATEAYRQHLAALEAAHQAAEAAQKLAQSLARHDALTGLPNRRVFTEAMEAAVARANRGVAVYAILLFDLDRFKPINDLHGHAVGDFVLSEIANRLGEVVRKSDTLARLGGDEFGVILECVVPGQKAGDAAMRLAERIIEAVNQPITRADLVFSVGASVGIAICPVDGSDPETLLRAADMAMYRAKADGRGTFCFFQPSMEADLRAKVALEDDVRQAVAAETIQPFYQPLMKLAESKLIGFEILARWHHPERGDVPPDIFIPIVEKLGLISQLTYSLLRRACIDARAWPPELTLAINVSPVHFADPLLPVRLLAVLSETGFPPDRLEIEVTETALMSDIVAARAALVGLQNLGIKISLDDFGTGYSSLYHLRELRFDKIKIDRSFVLAMEKDAESVKIVHSVIALAKSLGLPTIAEGIEHVATMRQIVEGGAEYGQGFYFGKAMPADEASKLAQSASADPPLLLTG